MGVLTVSTDPFALWLSGALLMRLSGALSGALLMRCSNHTSPFHKRVGAKIGQHTQSQQWGKQVPIATLFF